MWTPRRQTSAVITALALLIASVIGAQNARAGEYVMRNCNVPGYPPAPMRPWQAVTATGMTTDNQCLNGGPFSFVFPGARYLANTDGSSLTLLRPTS